MLMSRASLSIPDEPSEFVDAVAGADHHELIVGVDGVLGAGGDLDFSGVADGVTQRESNGVGGSQIQAGTASGATQGMKAVANRYAERTLALIERDGAYVRVPAGKQFYLYVRQPIILDEAKYGATLATEKLRDDREAETRSPFPQIPAVSVPPQIQQQQIETIIRQMEIQKKRESSDSKNHEN